MNYTKRSISLDPRANQNKAISKKTLIENLISDFDITIHSPGQDEYSLSDNEAGVDIISKSITKLEKECFDIILLDYLLGHQREDTKTREFGHFFLEELKEDHKQENPNLNLGPFSKNWIFPISSFPFALSDKMKQLGINNYSEIWYISRGGDPISSPHLFRYYFYKFIRQQVLECFMEGYALTKYLKPLNHIQQIEIWATAVIKKLDSLELKRIFLESDLDKTPFINGAYEITANKFRKVIKQLNALLNILSSGVKNYSTLKQFEVSWAEFKQSLVEEQFPRREYLQTFLETKFAQSIYAGSRTIKAAIEKGIGMQYNLSEKRLLFLPDAIGNNMQLRILWLNDNNLEELPETFSQLTSLERLYLSHNNFLSFPEPLKVLVQSHQLHYIDFRFNPLPGISRKIATNKEEAMQMIEEVETLQNPRRQIEVIEEYIRVYELGMAIQYFKDQVKWLADGRLEEEISDALIILEGEYNWLEKTKLTNTINQSEYQIQRSKLNDRMLGMLRLITKKPKD
jgi:Leucine-rich repeat (LRR) protein